MCAIEEIVDRNLEYLKEEKGKRKGEEKVRRLHRGKETDSNVQIHLGLHIRTP